MKDEFIDDDETLDFILYKEIEKEKNESDGKSGCLTLLVVPIFIIIIIYGAV